MEYPHKVAGIYSSSREVEEAHRAFLEQGFLVEQLCASCELGEPSARAVEPDDMRVRNQALRGLGLGLGVGTGTGVAAALALGAALPMLYATVPVMGPLAVAGYGAFVGTALGGLRGLRLKDSEFAAMVQDAVHAGCCVLVIHCRDEDEQRRAGEVLDHTMAGGQLSP